MMSRRDISPVKEEGADVDRVDRDGTEWGVGAADPDCLDLNYASLCLMVAASMAHIKEKGSDVGKVTEKWCKILVIAEGKMSLS